MNNYKMVFTPKKDRTIDAEKAFDTIDSLLNALYKNGQIINYYDTIRKGKGFFSNFVAYDNEGLTEKYNNEYVTDYYGKLKALFDIRLSRNGENLEIDVPCQCKTRSWYYLRHNGLANGNSVVCGDCGRPVPVYRFPHVNKEKEYYDLTSWEFAYYGISNLWINGYNDPFTYKQMNNPNSKLSKCGRRICRAFEKATDTPFYYYLHYTDVAFLANCDIKETRPYDRCPVCGEAWERQEYEDDDTVELKCANCRLMAYEVYNK